jgi:hypothetical protein
VSVSLSRADQTGAGVDVPGEARPSVARTGGALVVFVPHAIEDAGNLTYLIDATRHVAS